MLSLLSTLPHAGHQILNCCSLVDKLIDHQDPIELKRKALKVLANILVDEQACVRFASEHSFGYIAPVDHECQL